ncbi:MAG: helix-turn-helix transcriptional regulator, partial [Acidimicrobiales bacterium]
MDKLERLLNLAAALLHTPRPLTAVELTDRIGGYPESKAAFQRAFERDKDDLRSMGVPIRVEPVPGVDPPIDGYRIDRREYAGKELRFEPDELAALHLATNLVRLQGGPGDGLVKLGAATHEVPTPGMGRLPFDEGLELLMAAAAEHRIVTFGYNHVDREVEPWRVSFKRGHWYLTAWDRGRAGERIFRIDRIAHPIVPTGRAEAPVRVTGSLGSMRGWSSATPSRSRLVCGS